MSEEKKAEETKPAEAPPEAKVEAKEEKKDDKGKASSNLFYPNKWGRGILTSAEEIMGEKGVRSLLHLATMQQYIDNYPPDNMKKEFSFEDVAGLQEGIWEMYGKRGARVFAVRAGEATFQSGLTQFKTVAKAAEVAMKVSTLEAKIRIGLEFFSKFFNSVSDQKVVISEDEKNWYWTIEKCPMCWDRKSDEPVCYLGIGVLQGALGWVTEGKKFRLKETECIAAGGEKCVIAIEKVPVE